MDVNGEIRLSEMKLKQQELALKQRDMRLKEREQQHKHKLAIEEHNSKIAREAREHKQAMATLAVTAALYAKLGEGAKPTDNTTFVGNVNEAWKSITNMNGSLDNGQEALV